MSYKFNHLDCVFPLRLLLSILEAWPLVGQEPRGGNWLLLSGRGGGGVGSGFSLANVHWFCVYFRITQLPREPPPPPQTWGFHPIGNEE